MKLPAITGGRRFWFVSRLVGYGVVNAAAVFCLAQLVRHGLLKAGGFGPTWPIALGIVGLGTILFGLRVLEAREAEGLGQDYVIRVRQRILESTVRQPWSPRRQLRLGVTMSRLVTDLNSLRNWVSLGLARMISAGVALVGLLAALALFHLPIAGATLAVVALVLGGTTLVIPSLRRRVREARKQRGRLANQVGEQLVAALTARHLGQVERELRRAGSQGRQLRAAMVRRATVAAVVRRSPELGYGLAIVALLYVVSLPIPPVVRDSGGVAVILFLIGLVVAALRDLVRAWDYRIAFEEGRRRIARLLREPLLPASAQERELAGEGPLTLLFDEVRWRSEHAPWSFVVAAGERVVIAGASGTGKSMLVRLAARLLDPCAGGIRIDGIPLPEVKDLHRVVQLVSPEVPLLRGTVQDNLQYGLDPASAGLIEDVAAAVGILDDETLFPEGLDTPVAEGGRNLASGARARTILARALLANPRLLLVDDPAFLLDEDTALALHRALEHRKVTLLMVGAERPWPIVPDWVWRLSTSGAGAKRGPNEPATCGAEQV